MALKPVLAIPLGNHLPTFHNYFFISIELYVVCGLFWLGQRVFLDLKIFEKLKSYNVEYIISNACIKSIKQ